MGNEQQLSVQQCVEAHDAIEQISHIELPVKASYRLSRLHSRISKVAETYQESHRKLIIEKYGVADKEGNYRVPKAKFEAYQKEAFMLLDEKETIQVPELPLALFEDVEKLPTSFFRLMGELITE